jgi:hypothetical protein
VCGLKSKLLNPDFENLIKSYDVLVFVESKLNKLDELKIPHDYSVYSKCRKKCKRRSGGIAIVYKKSFSIFLNFLNSESEYVQWVEFYKDVFGPCDKGLLHSNFLLGCVHLPPGSSKLSSEEAFIEIENEMIRFSNNHSNIALVGDFNARSVKLCDIVEIDEYFFYMLM